MKRIYQRDWEIKGNIGREMETKERVLSVVWKSEILHEALRGIFKIYAPPPLPINNKILSLNWNTNDLVYFVNI